MEKINWRSRLEAAIDSSEKSMRAISIESGNGPGYVHGILKDGKDPTIEKLMAVCDAVPVSLAYVIYGFEITREDADLLSAMKRTPEAREAVLTLLRPDPQRQ